MSIFKKANRLPQRQVDALVVLSYCVAEEDPHRLTIMSRRCLLEAVRLFKRDVAQRLIITAAQAAPRIECDQKLRIIREALIPLERVIVVMPIANTYDEAAHVRALCLDKGIHSILLVAEERHMPRAFRIFQRAIPGVALYNLSAYSPYEAEMYIEARGLGLMLKRLRSRSMKLRLLMEWPLNLALPLLVRKQNKSVV